MYITGMRSQRFISGKSLLAHKSVSLHDDVHNEVDNDVGNDKENNLPPHDDVTGESSKAHVLQRHDPELPGKSVKKTTVARNARPRKPLQ